MERESLPEVDENSGADSSSVPPSPSSEPGMPAKLQASYDVSPERMAIVSRARSWGVIAFMGLWLTGWTVGCVFLTTQVVEEPELSKILFGLPFWVGWLAGFAILFYMFFGLEELIVDSLGVHSSKRAVWTFSSRSVPIEEIVGLRVADRVVDSEDKRRQWGLEFLSVGKPLWVMQGLPEAELRWLVWQLGQWLDVQPEFTSFVDPQAKPKPTATTQTLTVERELPDPPSDCQWELESAFEELTFANRGRFSLAAVLVILGVCLFWNGIVSVFLLSAFDIGFQGPKGGERWFLLLFLIPFELIGLAMLGGLVLTLLEPFRVTRWRIARDAIVWRRTWLGLGQRKSWPVTQLSRLELQPDSDSKKLVQSTAGSPDPENFRLVLIDREQHEICRIADLSQGEVRWMGQHILQTFGPWFPHLGTAATK